MKTRVFKKVLSVICVLAMLMSVCVVSLVGTSSAAETYSLNVNGKVTTQPFNEGDSLPIPSVTGVSFEGWYDSTFTTKYTTAGAEKTLYAKFASTIIDFEIGADALYNPNNNFASSGYQIVTDPTDSSNKCLKYTNFGGRCNFGIPLYSGFDKEYPLVAGQKYEVSYRYNATSTGSIPFTSLGVQMYVCATVGIGTSGGDKKGLEEYKAPLTDGEWANASFIFTANEVTETRKYLLFSTYQVPNTNGTILFDDIMITPIVEKEYTFNNKGTVTTEQKTPGDALPGVRGASFEGWYDKTLTYRYNKVPTTVTELYAKFNKVTDTFANTNYIYDPNNNFATGIFSVVADPADANNGVLKANVSANNRSNYAIRGAIGADAGYTITKGQVYTVSFKYKASGITSDNVNVDFYTAAAAGIGATGNEAALGWTVKLENSDTWVQVDKTFILNTNSTINLNIYKNILFSIYSATAGTVYIDDLSIAPYVPAASTEDFEMDFESTGEDGFKWSVADANNYTTSSGNGYVNRGQLVTDSGNTFFRVKHFAKKGAYIYFTLNNGSKQFDMINYGLYTLEFDYKVEHSETPSAIGLVFVKPTTASTGFNFHKITEFDSFEYRDDSEWVHVTYTFGADLREYVDCTSIGLYVYNSTNVPEKDPDTGEEYATSVAFDNIKVTTHSASQEDGMIIFDSLGGTSCTSIVATAGEAVGTLPQPTKYGYVFQGWKYDVVENGETVTKDLTSATPMPDFVTSAYADWKLADGVVELVVRTNVDTYDAATPAIIAFPGKPIEYFPTVNPTAAGQKFVGWYYDTAFTKPVDVNCAPDKSATIYAKWESEGTLVNFEEYPSNLFTKGGVGNMSGCTDRMSIETLSDGNHVLYYDFSRASNKGNTTGYAGIILYDTNGNTIRALEGFEYTVKFKYKVLEAKGNGGFGVVLSGQGNTWDTRMEQTGAMEYGKASDQWLEGSISFIASQAPDAPANKTYLSFGVSNDCKIYIDDIVVISEINDMNVYGSAVIFNTNGGKKLSPISGDPGTKIDLPTPVKAGYKFIGWYSDKELTTPVTDAVYGVEMMTLYAKWQLGKYTEGFEDYPASVKALGIAGAYSFYTKTSPGFDASNVHGGDTSLFRNGATAGVKSFTTTRSNDLAITVGDTYTLSFYVKPTSVTDAAGTISMIGMTTFTGKDTPVSSEVITKVSDLKEGEWNLVTYTFTATSQFVGIQTTAGNDMYFDDISVTLKGYTGSANTGDTSVNPMIVIALVIICAGALIITGKKVFSK